MSDARESAPAGRPAPRPAGASVGQAGAAGWPVLHLFFRIDRARWRSLSEGERAQGIEEARAFLAGLEAEEGLQTISSGVVGKADLSLLAVHADLLRLQRLTQELAATTLGACLLPVDSFLSISERSEYISTTGDHAKKLLDEDGLAVDSPDFQKQLGAFDRRMGAYAESRIHPQLPGREFGVLCFYPMSKARGETNNWYRLPFNERKRLMASHAEAGRRYADRVTQLVTSSTGLDDWEWGVTLFAREPKPIRDIVYEMRYDVGSALYGLFGPFYVSVRFAPSEIGEALHL